MHIKFLAHGTGSAATAVEYLLGELDHEGRGLPRARHRRAVRSGDGQEPQHRAGPARPVPALPHPEVSTKP